MLSHAGSQIGHGWAFGLNEFLDQTGATIGPLIVALVLYARGGYHNAFAILLIPALLCLVAVTVAKFFIRARTIGKTRAGRFENKRIFQSLLALHRRGRVDCGGLRRFLADCISFSKSGDCSAKRDSDFLFRRDGHGRAGRAGFWEVAG